MTWARPQPDVPRGEEGRIYVVRNAILRAPAGQLAYGNDDADNIDSSPAPAAIELMEGSSRPQSADRRARPDRRRLLNAEGKVYSPKHSPGASSSRRPSARKASKVAEIEECFDTGLARSVGRRCSHSQLFPAADFSSRMSTRTRVSGADLAAALHVCKQDFTAVHHSMTSSARGAPS